MIYSLCLLKAGTLNSHLQNYKYVYTQNNPPQKVSYKHSHSITQKIDTKASSVPPVTSTPVAEISTPTISSSPPAESSVPITETTPAPSSGSYLGSLGGNDGSSSPPKSYAPSGGIPKAATGFSLGSSYLDGVSSAAPVALDFSSAPMESTPPPVEASAPVVPAESTPAPSTGAYLSNISSGGGSSSPPKSYAPSGGIPKLSTGSNLGSSYLDGVVNAAPVVSDYPSAPVETSTPEITPAPSTGAYLSNISSGSGSSSPPKSYAPSGGIPKAATGSGLGSSYLDGVASAAPAVTDYSTTPVETSTPESTPAPSTGAYLSNIGSGGGSSSPPKSYAPSGGIPKAATGSGLGSSYLDGVANAAPVVSDYPSTPVESTPPPVEASTPAVPAESTPAPSTSDYLASMGSGGGSSSPPKIYAPSGGIPKAATGSSLTSFASSLNGAIAFVVSNTAPSEPATGGSIEQRFDAAKPNLSSLVDQSKEETNSITETPTAEAELIPTVNDHAYDTFISGLKVVTTDMGKSMREAVGMLAQSGDNIAASIKRSSVTLAASNIIGNDALDDDCMENRLELLKRTVDEMK